MSKHNFLGQDGELLDHNFWKERASLGLPHIGSSIANS